MKICTSKKERFKQKRQLAKLVRDAAGQRDKGARMAAFNMILGELFICPKTLRKHIICIRDGIPLPRHVNYSFPALL